ncbi:MAG: membrane protein insertion efficiency factor YidD [Clostridia bacterium]|nr:membrane protein insertion efficiency factor YidD [Clostridia bacterium]
MSVIISIALIVQTQSAIVFVVCFVLFGILFVCLLKKFTVILILLYQKLAPENLRKACVFTPTCSEYMLLAIDKYGVFKGICKGIGRLMRCHSPNGGEDYP